MTPSKRGASGRKGLLARIFAPLIERRAWVLIGLILLAAMPGLVQIDWRGTYPDASELSPFAGESNTAQSFSEYDLQASEQDLAAAGSGASDVEWESYANVEISEEQQPIDFDCMIEPWETVSVRSPVIGRIDAIHVERADVISAGDLLLELDADLSRAELEMARQRAGMTASVRAFEARRKLGVKRGDRAVELFSRNAIALDARDEILMEKQVSNFDLEDARDQQKLAELQLDREQARFSQRRIRSPFNGVVADRLMSVGEIVDEETVLELAQIDPLRVEVILPAVEFGSVQTGMKAAVVPEIPGDEVVVATVRIVDRIIDSASGTFGAELELPNPNHEIPGGLRCRVRFLDAPVVESEELASAESDEP